MILKKPYAFFIKMFKPIHLLLTGLVMYLIFLNNDLLKFLNEYMYSSEIKVTEDIVKSLISDWLYIIPVIVIFMFLILLGIMYKKNKPILFYFVGICSFVVVIIINVYTVNIFKIMIDNVVSIKTVKFIHDLVFLKMIMESLIFVFLLIRGVGLDFKKFDFGADISKFEINEKDNEEFELNIDIDFNEKKRKRKENIRKLKYLYIENKVLINVFVIIFLIGIVGFSVFLVNKNNKVNKENVYYSTTTFDFKINNTILLNQSYNGKQITENYLVIVNFNIKSKVLNNHLHLNDFSLKIGNLKFKPTEKYFKYLLDLGEFYREGSLTFDYDDYLIVFEIPEKYINSEMLFAYNDRGNIVDILLEPNFFAAEEFFKSLKLNDNLKFEGALEGVEFKINDYEIAKKFLVEYDYCLNDLSCVSSREYLKPSIDKNYDKTILKLNLEYNSSSDLNVDKFYNLISQFGVIRYKKNGVWYDFYDFEEITSKKVNQKSIYIGVISNIENADNIKIVFDIRGLKYEYILK